MSNDCETCVIRNRTICAALSAGELAELNRLGRKRTVKRGEKLMWEGDEALLCANVIEGVMQLSTSTADGRQQIVGIAYPADFIGRPFGGSAAYDVTALTDSRICVFSRQRFDDFAHNHPGLEHRLLERTLDELDRARRWMLLLGRKTAEERVASLIMEMSMRLADAGCGAPLSGLLEFELPLSRQQIADVLGLTIETVSRQLGKMKDAGLIATRGNRGIRILSPEKLRRVAALD